MIREAAKEVGVKGYQRADVREKRNRRQKGPEKRESKIVGSGTGNQKEICDICRYLWRSIRDEYKLYLFGMP